MENDVPVVPDGLVQATDGIADTAGHATIADQLQRGLQLQPCREQPADHDVVLVLDDLLVIFGHALGRFRGDGWAVARTVPAAGRGIPGRPYPGRVPCR